MMEGAAMGRRGSISEEQVFEAADALVAQGKEVTPTALLGSLGSGSFTTIYKHLSAWEASRATAVTDRAAVIPETVLSAFGAAWRAASAEAGKEVLAVKEQAAEDVAAAKAQFQEALETIERLEAESEADASRIDALSAKIAELEKALHQAENENAALKATSEQLRHQVKSQQSELDRVHKDADSERKRHQEEMAKATASASAAQDKAITQIEQLRQQVTDVQTKLEKAERERAESQIKAQEAAGRADKAEERALKSEQETAQARKDKEAAIKEAAELRGKANALDVQNKDLLARLSDKTDEPKKR
jgi:chromosome segregation ATPase